MEIMKETENYWNFFKSKGHNSAKNYLNGTKFKLDLRYFMTYLCTEFQFKMSRSYYGYIGHMTQFSISVFGEYGGRSYNKGYQMIELFILLQLIQVLTPGSNLINFYEDKQEVCLFVDCGLMSHSAIFQLYSDGTDVQFPNFDLLPGTHAMGS